MALTVRLSFLAIKSLSIFDSSNANSCALLLRRPWSANGLRSSPHRFAFSPTCTHFIEMCSTAARHLVAETDLFNFAAMRSMDVLASIRDLRRASSSGVHLLLLFSGTAIHLAP